MDEKVVLSETKGFNIAVSEFKDNLYLGIGKIWKRKADTEWQRGKGFLSIDKEGFEVLLDFLIENKDKILEKMGKN